MQNYQNQIYFTPFMLQEGNLNASLAAESRAKIGLLNIYEPVHEISNNVAFWHV